MEAALFEDPTADAVRAGELAAARAFVTQAEAAWAFALDRGAGLRTTIAELGCVLHLSELTAQDRVNYGFSMTQRPVTRRALLSGRLTVSQSQVLLEELTGLDAAVADRIEAELLGGDDDPVYQRPAALRAWIARRVLAHDPDGATARRKLTEREETGVRYRALRDGLAQSVLTGPAIAVQELMRTLDRLTPPCSPEDDRTRGQLLFVTAIGAISQAAEAAGVRPVPIELHLELPVTTDAYRVSPACALPEPVAIRLDLAGLAAVLLNTPFAGVLPSSSVPELLGHGPVDPALVNDLLGRAVVRRLCVDRLTGVCAVDPQPVPLTDLLTAPLPAPPPPTGSYVPTEAQRSVVRARSACCSFPGCTHRARRCDNDHLRAWPDGETAVANLHPLCRHHHQCKQQGWTVLRHPDGSETWTSPHGIEHRSTEGEQ